MINLNLINTIRKTITDNPMATRNFSADGIPDWYVKKMLELSEKYRPIRWLPLDIPKFELDKKEFLEFWDREYIDVVRTKPCTAEPWTKEAHPLGKYSNYYKPQFKGIHFYTSDPDNFETIETGIFATRYQPHPMFDKIIEQIRDCFPFYEIIHAKIWESVRDVYPHRDQTFFWNCPTEFRVMLFDDNSEPTLYVADVEHGDAHYIDLKGLDTNSFCWSNGSQIHGSNFKGNRKHLICIDAKVDPKKLDALLEKSIAKYKDKLNYKLEI